MVRDYLIRCFFPFSSLFLLISCSSGEQAQVSKPNDAEAGGELRLVIRWGGDDFASRQDLELRSKVEGLIEERDVGRVLRSGTGMGWMDVWVKVENKAEAKEGPGSDYGGGRAPDRLLHCFSLPSGVLLSTVRSSSRIPPFFEPPENSAPLAGGIISEVFCA